MLEVKNIQYSIGQHRILKGVSAAFEPGKVNMIIGPNGSGKSTLLKIVSNEINNYTGEVHYDKRVLGKKDKEVIARVRAVLSQESELSFPLTVEEVVMMGRYPHFSLKPSAKDNEICQHALEKMNIAELSERNYLTLSGGEKQRVHFARVLAQIWDRPKDGYRYLLLDEPIASLDLNYQHEFLHTAQTMAAEGTVVVAVIHDLNLVLQYASHVIMLMKGELLASGTPSEVITSANLFNLYGLNCHISRDEQSGRRHVVVA